jgi:hypothetical protein
MCSVVKHSSHALLKWAQDMSRSHEYESIAGVANACLALARPRKLQPWDVYVDGASGGTSSAAMNLGGYTSNDPSMSRWFMNILGAQPSDGTDTRTHAHVPLVYMYVYIEKYNICSIYIVYTCHNEAG